MPENIRPINLFIGPTETLAITQRSSEGENTGANMKVSNNAGDSVGARQTSKFSKALGGWTSQDIHINKKETTFTSLKKEFFYQETSGRKTKKDHANGKKDKRQ